MIEPELARLPTVALLGPYPRDPKHIAGGVQASVYGLANSLCELDAVGAVLVLAIPVRHEHNADRLENRKREPSKLRVTYLRRRLRTQVSLLLEMPRVVSEMKRSNVNVVHIHGTGFLEIAMMLLCRVWAIPAVWTIHGITAKETKARFLQAPSARSMTAWFSYSILEWIGLIACRSIIVDTNYVRKQIRTNATVTVCAQGIDDDSFQPNSGSGVQLVSVGLMSARKNQVGLVEAFARTRCSKNGVRLVLIGGKQDQSYIELIQAAIMQHGLSGCVDVRLDLRRDELLKSLRESDVFALRSEEESQGIAVCEAMASGLPIVASRIGGLVDVVDPGTGYLVELSDTEAFAAALDKMFYEASEREKLAMKARDTAKRYRWTEIATRIYEVYVRCPS